MTEPEDTPTGSAPTEATETRPSRKVTLGRRSFGRRATAAAPVALGGAVLGGLFAPQAADAAATSWLLTGNAGTTAVNFLGTTDTKPLVFRTKDRERGRVAANGVFGFGTTTPTAKVHAMSEAQVAGLFERTNTTGAVPALKAVAHNPNSATILAENATGASVSGVAVTGVSASGDVSRCTPVGVLRRGRRVLRS